MPQRMKLNYNGKDAVDVDVYQFSTVGQLVPSALCRVVSAPADGDDTAPQKDTWITAVCSSLEPSGGDDDDKEPAIIAEDAE